MRVGFVLSFDALAGVVANAGMWRSQASKRLSADDEILAGVPQIVSEPVDEISAGKKSAVKEAGK